jgi:hypothetical protein
MPTQVLGSPAPARVRRVNRTRERVFFAFMALRMSSSAPNHSSRRPAVQMNQYSVII